MTTNHTLPVPGARLHYEVRGAGPLVVLVGAPMPAAGFAALAEELSARHTVVTHDPRGISGSAVDDPGQESSPEVRADDVAAILEDLGAGSADVLGCSGGAVTALALAERHPDRVRTLVAHEPPLLELLPDAIARLAEMDDVIDTFHRFGQPAAWGKFMTVMGYQGAPPAPPAPPSDQDLADGEHFFAHELRATVHFRPDLGALTAGPVRLVVGLGVGSSALITQRTSTALAKELGTTPVEFPGDHTGYLTEPKPFGEILHEVLTGKA